jgi:curli biogenesis system outer membrane secretion channel CsgG
MSSTRLRILVPLLLASTVLVATSALAKDKEEAAMKTEIPVCDKKIGTMAVNEPEDKWWTRLGLESPEALLKVYAQQSKCWTLLDRGKGLQAAQKERALASGGEMRVGANVGKGQMKAADYTLVPDIANKNANSGGKKIGGMIGGLVGGGAGALLGGVSLKSKTADVVLTLTDVRSTEVVATVQGHAKKTDMGWGAGGGAFFGGFAAGGASSYANTEIGQVVAMAYLDAYIKLMDEVQQAEPDAKADNVQQAVTVAKATKLYQEPNNKSAVVRDLDAGMMLYPTGEKQGVFWKVNDELGNEGWVVSTMLQLAK